MSTPQPQPSRTQTPASTATKDNPSYANLRKDLEQNAELLKYLPFNRATFQSQTELIGAASHRLLYGDMMEEKDQMWIYFTMLGGGHNYNHTTGGSRMISFHTLKGAQNGSEPMHPKNVQKAALPAGPFKLARNHFQVMAIAKYFFIKHGVDDHLATPLTASNFSHDLVRACKDYKAAFEKIEAAKKKAAAQAVSTAGTYASTASRERENSRAATSVRSTSYTGVPMGPAADRAVARPRTSASSSKRIRSPSPQYTPIPLVHSPSQTPAQRSASFPSRPTSREREIMMDKYIALQAQEEELDSRICTAESERSDIAAQIVGLQARLNEAEENKAELMREKHNVRSEKKRLQASLESEEQLEFGFEAGRKMEAKRIRRG